MQPRLAPIMAFFGMHRDLMRDDVIA